MRKPVMVTYRGKGKDSGKVHPRTGHEGPEKGLEVQRQSFFSFGARWVWVVSSTTRPFYPGKVPVPIVQEDGSAPRAGLNGCGKIRPTGIRSPGSPARSESVYRLSYSDLQPVRYLCRDIRDILRIIFHKECVRFWNEGKWTAQRLMSGLRTLWEPWSSLEAGKFLTSWVTVKFSRTTLQSAVCTGSRNLRLDSFLGKDSCKSWDHISYIVRVLYLNAYLWCSCTSWNNR